MYSTSRNYTYDVRIAYSGYVVSNKTSKQNSKTGGPACILCLASGGSGGDMGHIPFWSVGRSRDRR